MSSVPRKNKDRTGTTSTLSSPANTPIAMDTTLKMADDTFSPSEITAAVSQLLQETTARQHELRSSREAGLSSLYLMIRTLIRGQGFAQMDDIRDSETASNGTSNATSELMESLDKLDREGLETFLDEYTFKEGLEARHIKLPELSHLDLQSLYPAIELTKAPSAEPEEAAAAAGPSHTLPVRPETSPSAASQSPITPSLTGLPLPTPTTLPLPPSLASINKEALTSALDVEGNDEQMDVDDISQSTPLVPVPDFSIPVQYEAPSIYTPRAVLKLMNEEEMDGGDGDETGPGKIKDDILKPWIGSSRNLALFQPLHHPLLYPPAGTGFPLPPVDESLNPTISPFGIPLSESTPRIPSNSQALEYRQRKVDELVPLESPYAAGLHPLPNGLVGSLGKRGHRHHHRRDRRRSSVGGGDNTGSEKPVNTAPVATTTAKVASSMMIPGTSAYALPPAYVSRRRAALADPTQVQAENQELSQQRAEQREKEEVDLIELGVSFSVNPVSKMVQRNNKCMMSKDWKTVWREIQFLRTLERVEELKDEGAWAFRQMKKARGPPGIGKSHWDWLLDEMRWMQADFKEERRWKIVLAREMAAEVQVWWNANDEEKAEMMVGGRRWGFKWQAPDRLLQDTDMEGGGGEEDEAEVVLESLRERDREVETAEEALAAADPVVSADTPVEDVEMADAEGEDDGDGEQDDDAEGEKDEEDEDAAGEVDDDDGFIGNGDIEMAAANEDTVKVKQEEDAQPQATALLTGQSETLAVEAPDPLPVDVHQAFAAAAPAIRRPILNSNASAVVIDIKTAVSEEAAAKQVAIPEHVLLTDLFPDLSVYNGPTRHEEKVEKRVDEIAGKLTHTSRLMDIRPVIVSSIRPAMTRRPDGKWEDLGQGLLHEPEDDLEEFRWDPVSYPAPIFEGKKARPLLEAPRDRAPEQPRNAAVRAASILWDEADDVVLKRLMGDYGRNWRLIADLFNSARNTISTDKRSAWDCYHRWDQKWGPSKAAAAAASNAAAPGEPLLTPAQQELQQARAQAQAMAIANHAQSGSTGPPPAPAAITIPPLAPVAPAALPASAIPTTASVTVGEESVNPDGATSPGAARREAKLQREARYQGSKKKVRNNTMRDAIRRSQKRRDINRKNNIRDAVDGQQVVTIHESHTGFLAQRGAPVPSPQELSQLQAERFAAEQEKLRNMRLAELRQQQLAQQQRLQQVQMQQHQAQQHQQQMQQARASQTPQNQTNVQTGGAGSTPQLTANPPTAGTGRQPPTPGAAQQIVMQQSQMVTQALQQAAQQQIQQQGPGNNGVPGAVNTGSTPNPTVNAQGGAISANQQPRAQITAPNVITLANGTRLTVPVNQGSPNLRMQNQAQQHIVQQRTANGGSGSPVNTVQGQPGSAQGSPHLNGQNASRPASRTGQSNAPNSQGGAVRPGQPGATGQGAPRQGQAINHNQAVITSLLQKAGMSTLNHIPIPPKPDGGQWTATEIVQQQVAYLHRLSQQHGMQAQAANNARSGTPTSSNAGSANGSNANTTAAPSNTANSSSNTSGNATPATAKGPPVKQQQVTPKPPAA